ncbi:MAG: hypothetical protein A2942_02050 [Candidatus Lloydbacteria bacterium RIFCSPLOWO2_01_FULL_50_20]|uniref:M23ase beta-sheet core domain-containing protein n=1 Tax=Candidatus Lloydbacteria bacterium RIFCSPLOWO2_01_FULL_50_20 TaxID=1798665 RepID=A0A1G2DJ91_9BACT|nr:MAG: hypothetical protein A3C13_03360 [Candidatus Lloydbacteria bacterium RIFCSPHIGHO2_02_FULL_50_11]OGZ13734.1 MAG: hypothetical protein A2942_02050 [Candidatus Lloydbacteria bacterium RIFCSPLOWO2_01_FULL_50_20]
MLAVLSVLLFWNGPTVTAQTSRVDELKQSISDNQSEIERLEAEIADYKMRLNNLGTQKKTLQNAIQTLDLTRAKLSKDIELTQAKIVRTNSNIAQVSGNISQKNFQIEKNKTAVGNTLKQINEMDSVGLLEITLGSESLSDFLMEIDDLARLQASLSENIKSLVRLTSELNEQKTAYQKNQQELLALKSQLADQKAVADSQRRQQSTLLTQTKSKESNFAKLLTEKEARKKLAESEIANFEAQLKAEIDRRSFPPPGTKVLAYPLDDVFVTQKFGRTVDSVRLYVSGTHNGMDFRATPGTPIKASAAGTVVGTGDTDLACRGASYGKWVLIRHQNGLSTLYAHLDLIKASKGQQVSAGEIIGYSGSTGYATGPHLHFTVYVASAVEIVNLPSKSCPGAVFNMPVAPSQGYLDPLDYL